MGDWQLSAPVVEALRARLDDSLPAAVDAVNATVEDGFTIDHPAQVLDYVPPESAIQWPTVCVLERAAEFANDTGYSATGRYELMLVFFIQDHDPQGLARKLRRYEQAVVRAALTDRDLADPVYGTGLVRIEPGGTFEVEDQTLFRSFRSVIVWAESEEE